MHFTRWSSFLTNVALLAFGLFALCACDDSHLNGECNNLIDAINDLTSRHVRMASHFDPLTFQYAQFSLLAQHHVQIPESIPKSSTEQCVGTLRLLQNAYPRTPSHEFSLELLSNYTRQWDPHSLALSEHALSISSSVLTGFGFTVERSDNTGRVEVVDVIAGGPAHAAGLQEGMYIWTINDKYVREISTTDLVATINGNSLPELVLGVRGGSSDVLPQSSGNIRIPRGTFEASPIKLNTFRIHDSHGAYDIGYIKIRNFVGVHAFFAEALRTLLYSRALVLDLRGISGGEIQLAADVAGLLLPAASPFVGFLDRASAVSEVLSLHRQGGAWDGPLVVLVNSTTKSAAEILAGALQDYGAIVVGTNTFGKGTRQRLVSLSKYKLSGGIYLTDGFTVRPSGKVIQFSGVAPDVEAPSRASPKFERLYSHALEPPNSQAALPGYDHATLPSRSRTFRARLSSLGAQIRAYAEAQLSTASREDAQLEAAKRVALFLARERDFIEE